MNIKNVLLTGGRAPVTLDLARYFGGAGFNVYVADSFEHALCRASNQVKEFFYIHSPVENYDKFLADLEHIIKTYNIHILIPTCEEVLYIGKGKEDLTKQCEVFCEGLPFLLSLHNKYDFMKLVQQKGLLTPKTYLVKDHHELRSLLNEMNYELVLKPVFSRFASKIVFFNKQMETYQLDNIPISHHRPYVVQERIRGKAFCSYSIFFKGKLTAHTVYDVPFTADIGASISFRPINHSGIEEWVRTFFEGTEATGQYSFDFIETEDGQLFPLECNPRATSGIHLFRERTLSDAFLDSNQMVLTPQEDTKVMLALAMLLYGWKGKSKLDWLKTFLKSKDAILSIKDIKPFFYQFWTYYSILKRSNKLNLTAIETTTYDIEWNGDHH